MNCESSLFIRISLFHSQFKPTSSSSLLISSAESLSSAQNSLLLFFTMSSISRNDAILVTPPKSKSSSTTKKTPSAPRKGVKDTSKVKKTPAKTTSSKPKLPAAPLKTKLGACVPLKEKKPFIKHEAKSLPVEFLGNFLKIDDNGKKVIEVDDDCKEYVNEVASNFSVDVDFKTPVRSGKGNTAGRFFISGSMNEETEDAELEPLLRQTVKVVGHLKTYHFMSDEGKEMKGCCLKIEDLAEPKEAEAEDDGGEFEEETILD